VAAITEPPDRFDNFLRQHFEHRARTAHVLRRPFRILSVRSARVLALARARLRFGLDRRSHDRILRLVATADRPRRSVAHKAATEVATPKPRGGKSFAHQRFPAPPEHALGAGGRWFESSRPDAAAAGGGQTTDTAGGRGTSHRQEHAAAIRR